MGALSRQNRQHIRAGHHWNLSCTRNVNVSGTVNVGTILVSNCNGAVLVSGTIKLYHSGTSRHRFCTISAHR